MVVIHHVEVTFPVLFIFLGNLLDFVLYFKRRSDLGVRVVMWLLLVPTMMYQLTKKLSSLRIAHFSLAMSHYCRLRVAFFLASEFRIVTFPNQLFLGQSPSFQRRGIIEVEGKKKCATIYKK